MDGIQHMQFVHQGTTIFPSTFSMHRVSLGHNDENAPYEWEPNRLWLQNSLSHTNAQRPTRLYIFHNHLIDSMEATRSENNVIDAVRFSRRHRNTGGNPGPTYKEIIVAMQNNYSVLQHEYVNGRNLSYLEHEDVWSQVLGSADGDFSPA